MSESTVLDALLGAIILLVALIGYWQGIVRSLILIAGAMIGSELALWWSDEAGDWLSDVLPWNPDTGRFVASTAFIVGASLLLGVTLGNMTARPASRARDRFTGIAVSLAAAALIIGLVIRYFHVHMATEADDALGETRLALALWEQFDWIVLVTAIGGVMMASCTGSLARRGPNLARLQARRLQQTHRRRRPVIEFPAGRPDTVIATRQ